MLLNQKTTGIKKKYDIAVVELTNNSELCSLLSNNYNSISHLNIGSFYSKQDKYYLTGFPAVCSTQHPNMHLKSSLFMFETTSYKKEIENNIKVNIESDIFLEYSRTIINEKGTSVSAPELQGISGGTIWRLEDNQSAQTHIWSPEQVIKLVAIECSFESSHYKWIRGVKLNVLAHIFSEIDKEFGKLIFNKLQ